MFTAGTICRGVVVSAAALLAATATATDYHVTVTSDSADGTCDAHCSLREAILAANNHLGADTVIIPAGTYVLSIAGTNESLGQTGDLDLSGDVTIVGAGPKQTVIDADRIDRVMQTHGNSHVHHIRGLTMRGGGNTDQGGQGGGGLWIWGENTVYLDDVHLVDNQVGAGTVLEGGGLLNTNGTLVMNRCVVSGNRAHNGAGIAQKQGTGTSEITESSIFGNIAVNAAGGLYNSYTTTRVVNTTISGNTGGGAIGGVYDNGDEMLVDSCTFTGNSPNDLHASEVAGTSLTLVNTLVAGVCAGDESHLYTDGGNLESPGDTCDLDPAIDRYNVPNALLEPLAYCGGPTPTHRLRQNSPAVDEPKAVAACQSVDQRGFARPRDGDDNGSSVCDVGAVEYAPGELFMDGFECGYTTAWAVQSP